MKIHEETYLDCIKGRIPEITKEQMIIVSMYTGCHLTNPIIFNWEEKLLGKKFLQDLSYQLTLEEYSQILSDVIRRKMNNIIKKTIKELNPKTSIILSAYTNILLSQNIHDVKDFCDLIYSEIPKLYTERRKERIDFLKPIINKITVSISQKDVEKIINKILSEKE